MLAIIIVTWNVRDLLRVCLQSLLADLERSGLEAPVWVVDNGSADGTPEMVRREFPTLRLMALEENVGFAAGNNRALRAALEEFPPDRLQYLWLLNPDTEVLPGATAALVGALERNPRAGIAGPKLLYPDGSFQHSAFRFPGLVQLTFDLFPLPARLYETPLNGRYPRRLYKGKEPFPVDHPLGAAMMVRRDAVDRVGLMDEGYRLYCEEIDWCWRMRRAGWGALCVPTAQVIHHAGGSTGQVPIPSFVNLWTSRARLYARHHPRPVFLLARLLVRVGMQRRMRDASPQWRAAIEQVLQAWEEAG